MFDERRKKIYASPLILVGAWEEQREKKFAVESRSEAAEAVITEAAAEAVAAVASWQQCCPHPSVMEKPFEQRL